MDPKIMLKLNIHIDSPIPAWSCRAVGGMHAELVAYDIARQLPAEKPPAMTIKEDLSANLVAPE